MSTERMTERERRAFNRGLEAAAKLADLFADENIRMCHHTLLADPVLTGKATSKADFQRAQELADEGERHSAMYDAGNIMAGLIRSLKRKA